MAQQPGLLPVTNLDWKMLKSSLPSVCCYYYLRLPAIVCHISWDLKGKRIDQAQNQSFKNQARLEQVPPDTLALAIQEGRLEPQHVQSQ